MNLTAIVMELVLEGYTLMALMSDDSIITLNVGYGKPTSEQMRQMRFIDAARLRDEVRQQQAMMRTMQNARLHHDKTRRFGHDYAARGY